jgi:hypothetical protein
MERAKNRKPFDDGKLTAIGGKSPRQSDGAAKILSHVAVANLELQFRRADSLIAGLSFTSTAARLSWSSSTRLALMITDVTISRVSDWKYYEHAFRMSS